MRPYLDIFVGNNIQLHFMQFLYKPYTSNRMIIVIVSQYWHVVNLEKKKNSKFGQSSLPTIMLGKSQWLAHLNMLIQTILAIIHVAVTQWDHKITNPSHCTNTHIYIYIYYINIQTYLIVLCLLRKWIYPNLEPFSNMENYENRSFLGPRLETAAWHSSSGAVFECIFCVVVNANHCK